MKTLLCRVITYLYKHHCAPATSGPRYKRRPQPVPKPPFIMGPTPPGYCSSNLPNPYEPPPSKRRSFGQKGKS